MAIMEYKFLNKEGEEIQVDLIYTYKFALKNRSTILFFYLVDQDQLTSNQHTLDKSIHCTVFYPSRDHYKIISGIDIDHVRPIANMDESICRCAWEIFLVGIKKPVHKSVSRLSLCWCQCP